MTLPWVDELDPERWAWTWIGYLPRRLLTDAFAEALAARQGAVFNDFDNLDPSALPFRAYDLDAIAWESGGTIQAQRNALKRANELNELIGTEAAFYILLDMNRCTGYHRYQPVGAKVVRTLAGSYQRAIGTPASAGEVRLNGETLEIWPHDGADRLAVANWWAGAIIEFGAGDYLQIVGNSTINGQVVSFPVLNPESSVIAGSNLTIQYHGPYTGVECYVTAPIDRAFDNDFLLYITDRCRRVWPFTLEVIAVHILTTSNATIYIQTASYSKVYSGWPGGV